MSPVPTTTRVRSRELLSEGVRRRILMAILDGTLVSGERLHDDQLVAWLGVSRTPIRTALERLAEIGLIEMQPNRFTRVALASVDCLVHALQVYGALAASAVVGQVGRLGNADVDEFRRRLEPVEAIGRQPGRWQRHDLQAVDDLLGFFSRRSGNPLLIGLLHEVRVRLAFAFLTIAVPIERPLVLRFAREILNGVERRDEAAVVRVLTTHFGARVVLAAGGGGGGANVGVAPGVAAGVGAVGAGSVGAGG